MTTLINDKGALNMQMYNEYQQKEREAFEAWHYEQYLLENPNIDIANAKYIYDYAHKNALVCQLKESHFTAWQAAKAQAVPDTYTQIVLALESVQAKIAKTSFLTVDGENENEIYAVDANELHEYIAELIEAQEPAND